MSEPAAYSVGGSRKLDSLVWSTDGGMMAHGGYPLGGPACSACTCRDTEIEGGTGFEDHHVDSSCFLRGFTGSGTEPWGHAAVTRERHPACNCYLMQEESRTHGLHQE
ncbi:hypothetical protein NDU88_002599 [Pleurodeles waltl]|uniref:Uncharacterized protein n=1 Tax=Pleurodeles waltl TaxID=8319 RepID=A0AAV7KSK0_PLEWA|nr:hypothetical protein NDU88_002599 [Pleurodeles waltl]